MTEYGRVRRICFGGDGVRRRFIFCVLAGSVVLGGCATVGSQSAADSPPDSSSRAVDPAPAAIPAQAEAPANESPTGEPTAPLPWEVEEEGEAYDPLERLNRKIYSFNQVLDRTVLKPVAEVYQEYLPQVVRTGVGNFFRNLWEPTNILNSLLQGKIARAGNDTARFIANSTVGLLGLVDVATRWGLPRSNEDFGQTLGVWGTAEGPYLVLPFFGPRTLRDTVGFVADWYTDPVTYIEPDVTRWGIRGVYYVDERAQLLGASKVLEQAGADEYLFVREAYRQRRKSLIADGNSASGPPGQ